MTVNRNAASVETEDVGMFTGDRGNAIEHIPEYRFKVREEPVATASGIVIPKKRAIVREDNDVVLGIVGSNYQVRTHGEILDPLLAKLHRKGIKTFQRVALVADGAKMFANIYFPDDEVKFDTQDQKADAFWPGISVINSLNGTLNGELEATIYRLACTNGMRIPTSLAKFKTLHSKNKDFDSMIDGIIETVSDVGRFATLQHWANKVLTMDKMAALADAIIDDKKCMFPARYRDKVHEEIKNEASFGVVSVWGLYNAFNSVLEHFLIREKGKYERARMIDENLYKVFEKRFK